MDYKYIEQLMERFWEAETTPEEEQILRDFFRQDDIPASLARYKSLFDYQREEREIRLDSDFDKRVLARLEEEKPVTARRISLSRRLQPFYKAAASVAIVMLLGTAAQHSFRQNSKAPVWDYNTTSYRDTYKDPQVAYNASVDALKSLSDAVRSAQPDSTDSTNDAPVKANEQIK